MILIKGRGWPRGTEPSPLHEEFKSLANLQDPFRIQFPTKVAYTFVAPAGKGWIDRVYVNEENVQQVTQYKHLPTPFNLAHKVVSFTLNDQQERGQSYWKMNSSILQDRAYKIMIEETFHNVNYLGITDKMTLWDVFLTCVRSKTVDYTKQKYFLTNSIRRRLRDDILKLEALPDDRMTTLQHHRLTTLKGSLRIHEEREIDGYRTRTRGLPKYLTHEPNIEFFAKLEKRRAQPTVIGKLQDKDGSLFSDRENLIRITTDFYKKLYTPSPVNLRTQHELLKLVDKQISESHKCMLDAALTEKELQTAVSDLNADKSPRIDGVTAEFYQQFWYLIHKQYFDYIKEVRRTSFPSGKNTSVTTIIYKDKGDVSDLKNYRPISLINVDVKILTKVLTTRLKQALPSIIHHTQTVVDGCKIDHTIHMLRNLIQIVNEQDLEAAFIFLDQEKAFDRMNRDILFKT